MPEKNLKVIGAGFGRTGTNSLKLALEQLGFDPCHHMIEVFKDRRQVDLWLKVADHKLADWEDIFRDYHAMVDFPGSIYYKELMAAYPDAKVILSVRESESWYKSSFETIYQLSHSIPRAVWPILPGAGKLFGMVDKLIWQGFFRGKFQDKAFSIDLFERWNDEVKAYVPAEKLLVFNIKEGWEPLCAFLDLPLPSTPFPHVNDRKAMLRRIRLINLVARALVLSLVGLVILLLIWFL